MVTSLNSIRLHGQSCDKISICLTLKLKVVGVNFDFLLTHVQDHRNFMVFNIDDLARFSFVLRFNDSHHVSRLEVLANHRHVNSQCSRQLRNANSLE